MLQAPGGSNQAPAEYEAGYDEIKVSVTIVTEMKWCNERYGSYGALQWKDETEPAHSNHMNRQNEPHDNNLDDVIEWKKIVRAIFKL